MFLRSVSLARVCRKGPAAELATMPDQPRKPSLWKTYTLRNIRNEIILRLDARLKRGAAPKRGRTPVGGYDDTHARNVGAFYDVNHDKFMKVYGEVIQAFRTRDINDLLDHQMKNIGFKPGQRVLDAGCGIAAPAIHFARNAHVQVDAITISTAQYTAARQRVAAANLAQQVTVVCGDYHQLARHFANAKFDVVYFLESFGHSTAKTALIDVCWEALKPGGILYIKDLFRRIPPQPQHRERIDREIRKINAAYRYAVSDLNELMDTLRGRGFILDSLKSVELELEKFEDLAISNEFQELTGIALIENWAEYVFPVDFFEIKCVRPEFDPDERLDRHFLQNRYHRRAE